MRQTIIYIHIWAPSLIRICLGFQSSSISVDMIKYQSTEDVRRANHVTAIRVLTQMVTDERHDEDDQNVDIL